MRLTTLLFTLSLAAVAYGQDDGNDRRSIADDKFRQLDELLPTPNAYRTASGAPGHEYWQQQVDYEIDVTLDDENQRILGSELIHYHNRSPDALNYLWVQLDPNLFAPDADAVLVQTAPEFDSFSPRRLRSMLAREEFDGGVRITRVADAEGQPLRHTIVKTMMRVDLPQRLAPGDSVQFAIDWNYTINRSDLVRGRTGCEYFEEDDNYLYEMAQWFPRLAAYTDYAGWQNKQFLGRGEFTLEFGNYLVRITAPSDHIVASTGVLQNPSDVLTAEQRERFELARSATEPIFIVTPEEAKANESSRATDTKTWIYQADDVRDFAWASSRKFIWDAQEHDVEGNQVMAMSYYPNEGEPLWSRYSTHSIIHTLDVYSRYSFRYPYPVAISVNGPVGGMEYPMICFNGPRPEKDGTYSERTKYGLISVIIHEVGHNYFPMIVNSDERQWTWMDEGLNTFLQYLTEQEWEHRYPSRRGEPKDIVSYMSSSGIVPIMTNSESLLQFGPNAYGKPATALNILRETVLGRELFDFAFREYSQRWMFKRPEPADFFRSLEDASAIDLDWFWRGWFYTTDPVDLAISGLRLYQVSTGNPDVEKVIAREQRDAEPTTLGQMRYADTPKRSDRFAHLLDFYNEFDELDITEADRRDYRKYLEGLEDDQRALLECDKLFYVVDLENVGGLVMPVILDIAYVDGSHQELRIPAEIWRHDSASISKLIIAEKEIESLTLDPHLETADIDLSNNHYPPRITPSRFQLFKDRERSNPMRKAREEAERKAKSDGAGDPSSVEGENE